MPSQLKANMPGQANVTIQEDAVSWSRTNREHSPVSWASIAGKVKDTTSAHEALRPNGDVVAYAKVIDGSERRVSKCEGGTSTVPEIMAFKKPASLSAENAASLGMEYAAATVLLEEKLELRLPKYSQQESAGEEKLHNMRVFILGGESNFGIALAQILHLMEPKCNIWVTASMEDQFMLLQRASQLVQLGAQYAIDGETPDLMDHLPAPTQESGGVDVILDLNGLAIRRPEICGLLRGRKRYMDCRDLHLGPAMTRLLEEPRVGMMVEFEKLMHDATEAFQVKVEMPSCGLSDDGENGD